MPPTNAGFDHMLQKSYIPVCYLVWWSNASKEKRSTKVSVEAGLSNIKKKFAYFDTILNQAILKMHKYNW